MQRNTQNRYYSSAPAPAYFSNEQMQMQYYPVYQQQQQQQQQYSSPLRQAQPLKQQPPVCNLPEDDLASSTHSSDSIYPAAFLGSAPPAAAAVAASAASSSSAVRSNGCTCCSSCRCWSSSSAVAEEEADVAEEQQPQQAEEEEDSSFVAVYPSVSCIAPRENLPAQGHVSWRCFFCSTYAYGHRCSGCGKSRDSAALRVFVGQLCREGAARMVQAIIDTHCKAHLSAPVLHIEEHTHAKTRHGKGVTWVYVHTAADMDAVIRMVNKRTFVAISPHTGAVGFRRFDILRDFDEDIAAACAEQITTLPQEVRVLIHHSPVTAEPPASLGAAIAYHREQERVAKMAAAQKMQQPRLDMQPLLPTVQSAFAPFVADCSDTSSAPDTPVLLPSSTKPRKTTTTMNDSASTSLSSSSSSAPAGRRYMWNPYNTKDARVVLAH